MGGDFSDGELAWTSRQSALREFTICPHGLKKVHPCEKPVDLMQWCISLANKDGQIFSIFDPYGGSGSTCRAAKNLKIKSVMIEREEKYCKAAANRMAQEVLI